MNQKVRVRHLAQRAQMGVDEVQRVFDVMLAFLEEGDRIVIPGFGWFRREVRPERVRIKFSTSRTLKAQWKEKFHA
jgi:nucleoid DNA-binding protein